MSALSNVTWDRSLPETSSGSSAVIGSGARRASVISRLRS